MTANMEAGGNSPADIHDAPTARAYYVETQADYLARARAVARHLGQQRDAITTDDVRAACPLPDDVNPSVMGTVLLPAEWELVRYVRSGRGSAHRRRLGLYRLRRAGEA